MIICWKNADAQIYAQGKNLNKQPAFFINVELDKKPLDPSRYLAKVDFYGKRRDLDWYLKEGVEHKSFVDKSEMISYLEENGWFYLKTESVRYRSSSKVKKRYLFRKSMMELKAEHEELSLGSKSVPYEK